MKIAILGYGGQGQAAYEYWAQSGHQITVCDANDSLTLPEGINRRLGKDYLDGLKEFELIIRTPALHPKDIVAANADDPDILKRVTTVTNEFMRVCPAKNIIGITGTKGKGTTSTMIAKMLEAAGKQVHLGGNIGVPPLDMLKKNIQPDDWVVLELANFQLIDIKYSPHIGVCLMITPEHLDWHADFQEYMDSKQQLFKHQKDTDVAIYYAENKNSKNIVSVSPGKQIPYLIPPGAIVEAGEFRIDNKTICKIDEIKLLGRHNWQNVCAAITAVWQVVQETEAIRSVLDDFTGLEHRLEFVRELNGVKYYDDSFGTTPETAKVAIEAFSQPKVIILGGSDKGSKFDALAQTIAASSIRQVILIGNTTNVHYKTSTPEIEVALRAQGVTAFTSAVRPGGASMKEIVEVARSYAKSGDIVLLSPACASFDMFKDYKDRGEQFKQAVQELS